jgi:hypothetical protein
VSGCGRRKRRVLGRQEGANRGTRSEGRCGEGKGGRAKQGPPAQFPVRLGVLGLGGGGGDRNRGGGGKVTMRVCGCGRRARGTHWDAGRSTQGKRAGRRGECKGGQTDHRPSFVSACVWVPAGACLCDDVMTIPCPGSPPNLPHPPHKCPSPAQTPCTWGSTTRRPSSAAPAAGRLPRTGPGSPAEEEKEKEGCRQEEHKDNTTHSQY